MTTNKWCSLTAVSIVCLLLSATLTSPTIAETLVMPRSLVDLALANHCAPLSDFFERRGVINPPYVYGWLSGAAENSAAFWCKKTETSDKPYKLMFDVLDPAQMKGCPTFVEWRYPRGLSVEVRQSLALRDFRDVADPEKRGPVITIADARVIVNEYDGLMDVFYCYSGRWLVASFE